MNLTDLPIPHNAAGMIESSENYYRCFYQQLIRMSNSKLSDFVNKYMELLIKLSKSLSIPDMMRAVIGCYSLHRFGYRNFLELSNTFDRTVPQVDPEYVIFTSYIAGKLTHHPSVEQSRYVQHLLERTLGWMRAKGRRARHLAAAQMIEALAVNAGSNIVGFLPQFQTSIWLLVSHSSVQVLQATAKTIQKFTLAITRYGRSDLDSYLSFLTQLCLRLLSFGSLIRMYAALILLEQFVRASPSFFMNRIFPLYTSIIDVIQEAPIHVRSAAFVTISLFSEIDQKFFIETVADEHFEKTEELIVAFPSEIVRALSIMMKAIPKWMESKLPELKSYVTLLINCATKASQASPNNNNNNSNYNGGESLKSVGCSVYQDSALTLLGHLFENFREIVLPLKHGLLKTLAGFPLTKAYSFCFVTLAKINKGAPVPEIHKTVVTKIEAELKGKNAALALRFIAALPPVLFSDNPLKIIDWIQSASISADIATRCETAPAIYNLSNVCKQEDINKITLNLLHSAVFDDEPRVRCSILKVLKEHCTKELGQPENMKFFEIYANDDNQDVRQYAFQIIANLADFNPLYVSAITRSSLLDYFFTIRHVNSLRQRSNIIQTLPYLIQASSFTIKAYSSGLMEIIMEILTHHITKTVYENFLEQTAETTILIRVIDSLSLLAPLDPELVSLYSNEMIPLICDYLANTETRDLALSILNLFQVLYTAPASCLVYREKAPMILSVCSKYLANTNSRKIRMAILKVVGHLGVMEVHQQPLPKKLKAPENIDPELARQFFHPSRDSDDPVDEVLLLQNQLTIDQYYVSFCSQALLDIFNDESLREYYHDAVDALVQVLNRPHMCILNLFDSFCSRLLTVMEDIESNTELSDYLVMYTKLISTSTHNTSPFLARSIKFITKRFCEELQIEFLDMILAFLKSIRDGFSPYASDTICLLIGCLEDSMMSDIEVSQRVLEAFSILGLFANDLLYLVIPKICDTIICDQTLNEVKIMSFYALQSLAKSSDVFQCLSVLVRALVHGFNSSENAIKTAAMQLVYILLKVYGKMFLLNAKPLFDFLKRNKMETLELKRLIAAVNQGKFADTFKPLEDDIQPEIREDDSIQKPTFNADVITARATALNLGAAKHLEKWLRSFIITLISSSPSLKIRACASLASLYYPFALQLFKPAFFSCWRQMKKRSIMQITNSFRQLLTAKESSESVVREIIDLIVFMDKIEKPLDLATSDVVQACLRYGRETYALRLQQKIFEKEMDNEQNINNMIDIFVQLGDWPNAIGIWKRSIKKTSTFNRIEIMSKLHMWDKVEPMYRMKWEQTKSFDAFYGLAETLASTANWDQLLSLYKDFKELRVLDKFRVAQFFAEAAMHLGQWDVLDETLKSAPDDNERVLAISAINAIHRGQHQLASSIVQRGFSLLASRPITLWTDNQQIHQNTMLIAQELMEIEELNRWVQTENKHDIEDVWNERMKTAPHDFDIWFTLLANRIRITDLREDNIITLFQMKSITLGTKLHNNAFDIMFPHFNFDEAPDSHKICYIVARYAIGDKSKAIEEMGKLTETITGPMNTQCHYFYANWLIENDESIDVQRTAYKHLKQVVIGKKNKRSLSEKRMRTRTFSNSSFDNIPNKSNLHRTYSSSDKGGLRLSTQVLRSLTTDVTNVDSLRKWADVNISLAAQDSTHVTKYVTNAIDALTQCAQISPSFPDVVQLLNLFFEHADHPDVFNSTAHACIEKLSAKLLLQASPQLLVQLSHNTPAVATFVHDILFQLLCSHYHDLIFSIIVTKFSKNLPRARAADRLLQEFHKLMPEQSDEIELIRKALLRAAVTWNEKIAQRITDAFDHYSRQNYDRMIASLQSVLILTSKPKCEMHFQFKEQHSEMLTQLEHIIKSYHNRNKSSIQQLANWCQNMQDLISEALKQIHMIQLSSISPQLCDKTHFSLAVPGTYKPDKQVIRIKFFVGQFNVYMSKQQPKDVVVMGEDGNFYQYLLKGHEDLRLDERIMQFFRLINSLLKKETVFQSNLIEAMAVIPLSMSHGLVQWVRGTDTLRSIIEQYRTIHDKDPLEEYSLLEQLSTKSFDLMLPVHKTQIIEKIFQMVPDTDIADFFWLKAPNAETWLKQTNTFSISTAMTSIVGYVIGLGDRHPSNLLIDRFTGKVIHIDFGDCFERASNRPFLPEVVPFRLTRMIVRAMGPTGVDGVFKTTFVNMSNILRENSRVLIMVLAIFVHEPLIDPEADDDEQPDLILQQQQLNKQQTGRQSKLCNGPNIKNREPNALIGSVNATASMKYISKAATGSIIDKGRVYMTDDVSVQSSVEMRSRVKQKLNGRDFDPNESLSVWDQAARLIQSATDVYNLGKMYSGWCPFW
ncbi:PIKK family atypical protein kinase [Tritrichomonas foetus]|uniref:Serine/threonine-protein kinase TOR n=1 Tax=Tritrichomonas foetus TaxID=1144522 RepID=A0A1J4KFE7_9EUKA|nr:PIKK family atypical protein kinase [Tritrichomonas foetus]|eukprot:OHT08492.1 PIKK family atypical protein kinase [Tritrichomonas foetus]